MLVTHCVIGCCYQQVDGFEGSKYFRKETWCFAWEGDIAVNLVA